MWDNGAQLALVCEQIYQRISAQTKMRRRIMRRLIWVSAVCNTGVEGYRLLFGRHSPSVTKRKKKLFWMETVEIKQNVITG
ncbi:hypothetical protein DPMN_044711 [Dreissena polymorpha]|uniref:Uncharacterized protein n=1 Tax=Dreissena polymorpha TaxID=45954 RepID=A0A9D4D510_DREPO|nr:hypothetical protein DPMN_044711 [Dreissena polymorpha]